MQVHKYDFKELVRDGLKVRVVSELGGRIMELSLDGFNFLFVNPVLNGAKNIQPEKSWNGIWQNFGGEKIWPAPQGWDTDRQWAGPPDNVLDGGYFKILSADDNSITTQSPTCARTGLKIERTISLLENECGVRIDANFENCIDKLGEWSVWPVIQVATPDDTASRYTITFKAKDGYQVMHGVVNNPQYSQEDENCRVDYNYIIGKVGANTDGNWVAYVDKQNGKTLVAMAEYVQGAQYPSNTNVQIWTSGKGAIFSRGVLRIANDDRVNNPPYMEVELLSPLKTIAKGEKVEYTYFMKACTIPAGDSVKSVVENIVISKNLSLEKCADSIMVSAKLGSFTKGKVVLKSKSGCQLCEPIEVSQSNGVEISAQLQTSNISEIDEVSLEYFDSEKTLTIEKIKL